MCSMVSGNNSFHLEWNNHLGNMQAVLESLYTNQSLVDVTIACRDGVLKAHKVILSACSPYFEAVFRETPCKHPVLILKGVNVHEMQALLRFMYRGQVDVPEADLSAVIATACEFKVKGFSVDGLPGFDEDRPDSGSEHDSETEISIQNVQPRVTIHNWKDDKKPESPGKNSEKLNAEADEVDITPVIVDSQSLQKSPAKVAAEKGEDKEEEEPDEEEEVEEEEEEDKKPNAEELAASLKAAKAAQAEAEETRETSPQINTSVASVSVTVTATDSVTVSVSTSPNASASASANASSGASPNAGAGAAAAAGTTASASASAPASANEASISSTNTPNSNSSAVSGSANANSGEAAPTPYRRETRYKGQKRVDVGIRPAAGRARSVDKREASGEPRSSTGYSSQAAKKLRMTLARKADLSAVAEHALPTVQRTEEKKLILESSSVDISITRTGSVFEDGPSPFVKIKAEAESADEDEDDEEATADMFCIPHLQELPDADTVDPSVPGEEVDITPRWSVHAPPQSSSGREQRSVVEAPAEEGEGDMACPYCFTRCPRFSDLKRHMRLHTEDKPHECEFCSLAFARASHLARHRRTHTGERPFRCPAPSCERTFSRQDKLKLHTQRAHPGLPCDLVQSGTFMRIRGRRRIREKNLPLGLRLGIAPSLQTTNSTNSLSAASSSQSVGPAVISLPFGDTSYLTSLSLGQQRYSDLTISPVTAGGSGTSSSTGGANSGAGAEELLKSVRQLGECTIQTLPSKVLAE